MPLLFDGMQNASKHGCQEEGSKTYSYGAFFGSSGICIGFQDEGGYFRRPEIKKIFEEKDMESLLRFQHANAGITRFFTETDGLFVDSEHQVLYCAQTFKDGDTVAIESQGPRKYVHTKNRLTT